MKPDVVLVGQVGAYCLGPFGRSMIPVMFKSRRSGNTQISLCVPCRRAAFATAAAPVTHDFDDMTVDLPNIPSA